MYSMARLINMFQFTIFLVYLVLSSTYAESTEDICSFPHQSIACKRWNYTNMDCSWRELVCIPQLRNNASLELLDLSNNELTVLPEDAFSGFIKLQTLDLSVNRLSYINVDTFSVLHNLLSLNLSDNTMSFINGTFIGLGKLKSLKLSSSDLHVPRVSHIAFTSDSPFQYLLSLQTLSLNSLVETGVTVTPATFFGLNYTLQVLDIYVDGMTTDTPFVLLSSLQYLTLSLGTCSHVNENLFVGLGKLKYLQLRIEESSQCTYIINRIDFSPLVSLSNFKYHRDYTTPDDYTQIQALNSLNSSLQTLELYLGESTVRLNSTTFESFSKWKESLKELNLFCTLAYGYILIEGSPFQWFPQLQLLAIRGSVDITSSWTSPKNTFAGLANLKEVYLNGLSLDDFTAADILNTNAMQSLKVLDLANNKLTKVDSPVWGKINDMSTLETIDLSIIRTTQVYNIFPFYNLQNKPNLTALNVNHRPWWVYGRFTFPNLVNLLSSGCQVRINPKNTAIHAPRLEELSFSGIILYDSFSGMQISAIRVL